MKLFAGLSRLIDSFRGEPAPDVLAPVQPIVTPDPQHAAQLERRFSELAYSPENGFHRDQRAGKSNVVQFPKRSRRA